MLSRYGYRFEEKDQWGNYYSHNAVNEVDGFMKKFGLSLVGRVHVYEMFLSGGGDANFVWASTAAKGVVGNANHMQFSKPQVYGAVGSNRSDFISLCYL